MLEKFYVLDCDPKTDFEAIKFGYEKLYAKNCVKDSFLESCLERERNYPTGINSRIPMAIPHTFDEHVNESAICLLRLNEPVDFVDMGNWDNKVKVRYVFLMALKEAKEHLPVLKAILSLAKDENSLKTLQDQNDEQIRELILSKIEKEEI